MTLGERIKKVRKETDLTQHEFGKRIGIKPNSISLIESGNRNASEQVILSICREFSVSKTWLRTGEGEMFVPVPCDTLDAFIRERGLSPSDRVLIEKFAALDAGSRQSVIDYVLAVADAIQPPAVQTLSPAPVDTRTREEKPVAEWTDEEIEADVAEYRRELLEEKKQAGNGSASSGSGGTRLA